VASTRSDAHGRMVANALERFGGPLTAYAERLLGDLHAARDVVQDVFLRLCEADPERVEAHLAPWLYRVCRNRAMDVRRKGRLMPRTNAETMEMRAGADPAADAVPAAREAHDAALAAISALPEAQQEAVRLKFQHGLSYREIAEVTGRSTGAVGVLIHEGVCALRRRLAGAAGVAAGIAAGIANGGVR
jgi:RNA polymerase sigma factor (sigma-70 family)